jgi:hypothetical protein
MNTNNSPGNNSNSTYNVNDDPNTFEGLFYSIFNKSNIILFLWFLAIYFIAYFVLGFLFNKNEDVSNYQLRLSRTIDMISLLCLLIIIIASYTSYSDNQKEQLLQNMASNTSTFINNPISFFNTLLFIVCFYIVVYIFRLPMDRNTKPIILSIIETSAWLLFVIIIFTNFFKYVLGISFTNLLANYFDWSNLPDYYVPQQRGNINLVGNLNLKGNTISLTTLNLSKPIQKDEVFNISNNLYTYDDAQSICSAYGSKLATYDQIEEAYKNGGEWCNYGWSDGQMAFFPTQKSTWESLQKIDGHKNDCGRPGVNGGYFANPYLKFGVNCYGKKPSPTDSELARMKNQQNYVYPKTEKDVELDKKVKFWKENADKLLVINSYNKKEWSEY